ncbi:unnamed protein product [Sympodiomycopsis kandeliae]
MGPSGDVWRANGLRFSSTLPYNEQKPLLVAMVRVYTDGVSILQGQQKAQAGWGIHFPDFSAHDEYGHLSGQSQSSSRAELWAVKRALEIIFQKRPTSESHTFFLDSTYCLKVLTEWIFTWRENGYVRRNGEPVPNADVIQSIDRLLREVGPVSFFPHSHSTYPGNRVVDELLLVTFYTSTMASFLASIYGTEQDKVNCSFYYKIGACRHGDRCSRKHTRPAFSQTILVSNVYQNPRHLDPESKLSDDDLQDQFDDFYEDFFCELTKYGQLVEMHVCDNVGDHLIGNVYARYEWEEEAQRAVDALNDRWYDGRPLFAELSPVTDFREACCRQNETTGCDRGGFCNFMHLRYASPSLVRQLDHELAVELRERASKSTASKGWKGSDDQTSSSSAAWKKGASSGDWRSNPSTHEPIGDATTEPSSRNPYTGDNHPEGFDGPDAGSRREYSREAAYSHQDGQGEKLRGWGASPPPPSRM